MATKCTRSMTCRCPDCSAAMQMFTAKDLVKVASSKVEFTEADPSSELAQSARVEPVKASVDVQVPVVEKKRSTVPSLAERRQMMKDKMQQAPASVDVVAVVQSASIDSVAPQPQSDLTVSKSGTSSGETQDAVPSGQAINDNGSQKSGTATNHSSVVDGVVLDRWPKPSNSPQMEEPSLIGVADTANPRLARLVTANGDAAAAALATEEAKEAAVRRRRTGPRSSKLPTERYQEADENLDVSINGEPNMVEPAPIVSRVVAAASVAKASLASLFGVASGEETTEAMPIEGKKSGGEYVRSVRADRFVPVSKSEPKLEEEEEFVGSVRNQNQLEIIGAFVPPPPKRSPPGPSVSQVENKIVSSDQGLETLQTKSAILGVNVTAPVSALPPAVLAQNTLPTIAEPVQPAITATKSETPAMGEVGTDIDYGSMPLEERLASTDWKARKSAYEELASRGASVDFMQLDVALVHETNASALDALLDACLAYLKNSPADLSEDNGNRASRWIPVLAKKCFTGRPSTRQRAVDVVLELFAMDSPQVVATCLVEEVSNKNAKIPVVSLSCLRDACIQFGAGKVVPPQSIIQAVEKGMAATPPAIRSEACSLAIEAVAWLGEAFKTVLSTKLATDAQKRELERRLKEDTSTLQPRNPLRKRKDDKSSLNSQSGMVGSNGQELVSGSSSTAMTDVFDLLPTHDVLAKLDKGIDLEKQLKEPKWSDRRTALLEVEAACGKPPKLPGGDYAPLVTILRKVVINDSHQSVVIQALQVLSALSEGLRAGFNLYSRPLLPALFEKLKDQKKPVTAAVDQVLTSLTTWSVCIAEERSLVHLGDALSSAKATPLQLKNLMNFVERSCSEGKILHWPQFKGDLEPLRQVVKSKSGHPDPAVRQAANAALEALRPVGNPQQQALPVPAVSSGITSRRPSAVVQEVAVEKVILSASVPIHDQNVGKGIQQVSSSIVQPPARRDSASSMASVGSATQKIGKPSVAPVRRPSTGSIKLPVQGATITTTSRLAQPASQHSSRTLPAATSLTRAPQKPVAPTPAEEMLEILCRSSPPLRQAVHAESSSARWEERAVTLQALFQALRSYPLVDEWQPVQLDAVAQICGLRTRDFAEANPNVMQPAWDVVRFCAERASGPCEYLETIVLTGAASKLSDTKQTDQASGFLNELASSYRGPAWVLCRLMRSSRAAGGPKTKQAIFDWISECVRDFGTGQMLFDGRDSSFEELLKVLCSEEGVGNASVEVRASSLGVLGEFCKQFGTFKFQKLPFIPPSVSLEVQRRVAGATVLPVNKTWRYMPNDLPANPMDEEEARPVDLSAELESMLPILNTSDAPSWKKREEALMQLERILASCTHKVILVNRPVKDLFAALGKRLDDTQRNLAARAATCLGMLAECVGEGACAAMLKLYGERLLIGLGDSKKNVASACQTALTLSVCHQGQVHAGCLLVVLAIASEILKQQKCDKPKVMQWMSERMEERFEQQEMEGDLPSAVDASTKQIYLDLLPALIAGFTAKEATARRSAAKIAEMIACSLPEQIAATRLRGQIRDLKVAEQRTVAPMIEEVLTSATTLRRRREELALTGGTRRAADVAAGPTTPPESVAFVESPQQLAHRSQPQMVYAESKRLPFAAPVPVAVVPQSQVQPNSLTVVTQPQVQIHLDAPRAPEVVAPSPAQSPVNDVSPVTTPTRVNKFQSPASAEAQFFTPVQPSRVSSPPLTPPAFAPSTSLTTLVESWEADSESCKEALREIIVGTYSIELASAMYAPNRRNLLPALDLLQTNKDVVARSPVPFLLWTTVILFNEPSSTPLFKGIIDHLKLILERASKYDVQLNSFEAEVTLKYILRRFADDSLTSNLKEKLMEVMLQYSPLFATERFLALLYKFASSSVDLVDVRVIEASLLLSGRIVGLADSGWFAFEKVHREYVPLIQRLMKEKNPLLRQSAETFVGFCETAANKQGKLPLVREWFSHALLRLTSPRTPPSPQKSTVALANMSDEAKELVALVGDIHAVATMLDEAPSTLSATSSPSSNDSKRETVLMIRAQKSCLLLMRTLEGMDENDMKTERMVEDTLETPSLLSDCAVILERLAMRRASPPDAMWRKAAPQAQLVRSLLNLVSITLSKRGLRFQCDGHSVGPLISSLLVVHARVKSLKNTPLLDKEVVDQVEHCFFGPLCITPGWLEIVLALDPAPVEFVLNGLSRYAQKLETGEDQVLDSLSSVDLSDCVRVARRTTWVPIDLIRVLETFAPEAETDESPLKGMSLVVQPAVEENDFDDLTAQSNRNIFEEEQTMATARDAEEQTMATAREPEEEKLIELPTQASDPSRLEGDLGDSPGEPHKPSLAEEDVTRGVETEMVLHSEDQVAQPDETMRTDEPAMIMSSNEAASSQSFSITLEDGSQLELNKDELELASIALRIMTARSAGDDEETSAAIKALILFKQQHLSGVFDFDVAELFQNESKLFVSYLKEKLRDASLGATVAPPSPGDIRNGMERLERLHKAIMSGQVASPPRGIAQTAVNEEEHDINHFG